jgi:phosphoribosylanthranilate isomerase
VTPHPITRVKICGLRTSAALAAALEAGADLIGLVFFPPSPRHVDLATAAALSRQALGRAERVALVVDADDQAIDDIVSHVDPDLIQLHGTETPDRVRAVRARAGRPVVKAVSVAVPGDAERALAYADVADLILYDARPPKPGPASLPGGNGIAFDWRLIEAVRHRHPFMLSGGLDAGNVAAAIAATGADIVDVSSGVETSPGVKSERLIAQFVAAAKAAA